MTKDNQPATAKPKEEFLFPQEAAMKLGISTRRINEWVREGVMPHIELPNGEIRFTIGHLQRFAEQQSKGGAS